MKKIISLTIPLLLALAMIAFPSAAMAGTEEAPSLTLGSVTYSGGMYYFSNATVGGANNRTILVCFSKSVTSGDLITLPASPAGFTVSASSETNNYSKRINVAAGTSADIIRDYIRGIGFTVASATQTVQVTVTTEDITCDTFYNIDSEHYYQFIVDPGHLYIPQFIPAGFTGVTWTNAYTAARERTYMGRSGYLATVTSEDEDTFLNSLSGGKTGWLGGTIMTHGSRVNASGSADTDGLYYDGFTDDGGSSGWYWACGPEIGSVFYSVNSLDGSNSEQVAAADAANSGNYYNWSRSSGAYEPNNSSPDYENCLTTLILSGRIGKHGTSFTWNDIRYNNTDQSSDFSAKGYFVEYGNLLVGDSGNGSTTFASDSGMLALYTVTFDSQSATTAASPANNTTVGGSALDALPTDPVRTGCTFGGWFTEAYGAGTAFTASTPVTGNITVYAKWTKSSSESVFVGGRKTLSAAASGGVWRYDDAYLQLTDNGDGTSKIKGLKAGTTTVTYSAGGLTETFTVTVNASGLPDTGQNFRYCTCCAEFLSSWLWLL